MSLTEQAIDLGPLSRFVLDFVSRMGHTGSVVPAQGGVAALGRKKVIPLGDEQTPTGRLFARRRRANVEGGRQHHHKVKVTPEEEGMLLRLAEAQHVTIPRLLVESALASEASETPTERKQAMAELFALHRLLAAISNNVNQIARHANATGEVQPATVSTLAKVREVAERIDAAIDGLSLS